MARLHPNRERVLDPFGGARTTGATEAFASTTSNDVRFAEHAIAWLRAHGGVHRVVVPGPARGGTCHVTGRLGESERWPRDTSLFVVYVSMAGVVGLMGEHFATRVFINGLVVGIIVTAALGWAMAVWRSSSRGTVRVAIVEQGQPVGPRQLAALWRDRGQPRTGEQRWVIARCGFSPSGLAVAELTPVRCLIPYEQAFVDTATSS